MRWLPAVILAVALACPRDAAAASWSLPDDETLSYAVKLGGWTVVDATFTLRFRDRATGRHTIAVEAQTTSIPSRVYRVTNAYETVIDVGSGLPRSYWKACDEAKFQESSFVKYAQADRHAVYMRVDAPTRRAALLDETHNLFSGLYYLRQHDFGAEPTTDFHLDAKGVYWRARATRTRNLRTAYGDVWEVRVDFKRAGGLAEPLQSDLLTDNIVRGDAPLTLHIRPASSDRTRPPMVVHMAYEVRGFGMTAVLRAEDNAKAARQE